jgi:hypothetical protein
MKSIVETKKPKKGRPSSDTEAVNLRLPRTMISTLDDYRRKLADLPSRPEAIRRLLASALKDEWTSDNANIKARRPP